MYREFCPQEGGCLADTPPDRLGRHPLPSRQTPPGQTPPWQADTPLAGRPPWQAEPTLAGITPPPRQVDTPPTRADPSPGQTPLLGRHPSGQTSPWQVDPSRAGRYPPSSDGYCSGRYAPYWNAFLSFIYCLMLFACKHLYM